MEKKWNKGQCFHAIKTRTKDRRYNYWENTYDWKEGRAKNKYQKCNVSI